MRSILALAVLLGALALPARADAQRVELAGRVTASRTVLGQRRVGEARYVAISDLFYADRSAYVEILDLATQTVQQVRAARSLFERRFGFPHDGTVSVPQGDVVLYRDGVVGLALSEVIPGRARRYWYAELDARNGRFLRGTKLAMLGVGEDAQVIGADPRGSAAWFALTTLGARGRTLVLRRLDLDTLEATDEARVALPLRASNGDREHAVHVHAAPDLSRFAIVEYVEDGVGMAPGRVYVVDPAAGTSFAVPAPAATYGVAFAPDGRYIYIASAQRGTIARIDVAHQRIDKQVAAPRYVHHLVVSPAGNRLFALASSSKYAVYDLPDLRARSDANHPAGLAGAMTQLYGNGIASLDGAFFIVPEADDRNKPPAHDRTYLIARLVD